MTYEFMTLESIDSDRWAALLSEARDATPFHSYSWLKSLAATYSGWKVGAAVAKNSSGEYAAAIPFVRRRKYGIQVYDSLPFNTYGGIVSRGQPETAGDLLRFFLERSRSSILPSRMTLTTYFPNASAAGTAQALRLKEIPATASVLPLGEGYSAVHKAFRHNVRKNIKRAIAEKVEIAEIQTLSEVKAFFDIASYTYKMHSNRMPYPLELYENIFRFMVPQGEASMHLAVRDGIVLAGSLHVNDRRQVMNWLTPAYRSYQEYRGNTLLIDHAIQAACTRGCEWYNLGASPLEGDSLLRFKQSWGASEQQYSIYVRW